MLLEIEACSSSRSSISAQVPKREHERCECQDALEILDDVVVLSDGATVGVRQREWAQMLVREAARSRPPFENVRAFQEWLEPLRSKWNSEWNRSRFSGESSNTPAWMRRAHKPHEIAGATLLWAELRQRESGLELFVAAIGDSCVLIEGSDGLWSFPLKTPEQFGVNPELVHSRALGPMPVPRTACRPLRPGDTLWFATDAVAKFLLAHAEHRRGLGRIATDRELENRLSEFLQREDIEDDDLTLVRWRPRIGGSTGVGLDTGYRAGTRVEPPRVGSMIPLPATTTEPMPIRVDDREVASWVAETSNEPMERDQPDDPGPRTVTDGDDPFAESTPVPSLEPSPARLDAHLDGELPSAESAVSSPPRPRPNPTSQRTEIIERSPALATRGAPRRVPVTMTTVIVVSVATNVVFMFGSALAGRLERGDAPASVEAEETRSSAESAAVLDSTVAQSAAALVELSGLAPRSPTTEPSNPSMVASVEKDEAFYVCCPLEGSCEIRDNVTLEIIGDHQFMRRIDGRRIDFAPRGLFYSDVWIDQLGDIERSPECPAVWYPIDPEEPIGPISPVPSPLFESAPVDMPEGAEEPSAE